MVSSAFAIRQPTHRYRIAGVLLLIASIMVFVDGVAQRDAGRIAGGVTFLGAGFACLVDLPSAGSVIRVGLYALVLTGGALTLLL